MDNPLSTLGLKYKDSPLWFYVHVV